MFESTVNSHISCYMSQFYMLQNTKFITILYIIPVAYQLLNLLKPTGYVMHQQFNIQQLYVLPTLYLCVLYSSENKQ